VEREHEDKSESLDESRLQSISIRGQQLAFQSNSPAVGLRLSFSRLQRFLDSAQELLPPSACNGDSFIIRPSHDGKLGTSGWWKYEDRSACRPTAHQQGFVWPFWCPLTVRVSGFC
jgi:hypothetical protein